MIMPGETEAGSAGMQPSGGIAWRAHRDDVEREVRLSRSPQQHIGLGLLCLENPRLEGVDHSLTVDATSPFHAEPGQTMTSLSIRLRRLEPTATRLETRRFAKSRTLDSGWRPGLFKPSIVTENHQIVLDCRVWIKAAPVRS
jgi:hypothetical protein